MNEREAADFLAISEGQLKRLVERKVVPAYMIAGQFLRFKKEELEAIRDILMDGAIPSEERIFNQEITRMKGLERLKEIVRANDIYIAIFGVIIVIIFLMLHK